MECFRRCRGRFVYCSSFLTGCDMTVGEAIRKARKDRGYSAQRLANKSGVGKLTIYKYEYDQSQPRLWCLIALADALNITLDELVGRSSR